MTLDELHTLVTNLKSQFGDNIPVLVDDEVKILTVEYRELYGPEGSFSTQQVIIHTD